jgi:hypothetical protein
MKKKKNYKLAVLNRIAKYSKPIIDIWEKPKIEYYSSLPESHQPVFIIGAPRTGSTILYQLITNYLDVIYMDNLCHIFYRNPFFGFWLSNILFNNGPHNSFNSLYGKTYGLHSPSEFWNFWYRWLPTDKKYIYKGELAPHILREIKNNIFSTTNKYKKSIIFKNLYMSLRLGMISEIAPNAKFIFIKREPLYVAQSYILRKLKYNIDLSKWWRIKGIDNNRLNELSLEERAVRQIFFIEKEINKDLQLFPKYNRIIIRYKEVCNKNINIIDKISKFISAKFKKNVSTNNIEINFRREKIIEDQMFKKLENEVKKHDWKSYKF